MNRKPDIIRTIVLIFAVGLVITGFTSMQSPDGGFSAAASTVVSSTVMSNTVVSKVASANESRRN